MTSTISHTSVIDRAFVELLTGKIPPAAPKDPNFKASYATPEETYNTLGYAARTADMELISTCLSPRMKAELGELGPLVVEIMKEMVTKLGNVSLGKLLDQTETTRTYQYAYGNKLVTDDDQKFVKVGGTWLIDN